MKYSQARQGRVFVVRLEDGDVVHEQIEQLCAREKVQAGSIVIVGGANVGSRLVVGPKDPNAQPVEAMDHVLSEVHEIAGVGTIFPDESGKAVLHMHLAAGREANACAGCVRRGVKVWQLMEAVLTEVVDSSAVRVADKKMGFSLLQP